MLKHTRLIAFYYSSYFIFQTEYVFQTKIPDKIRIPDKIPDNDVIMGLELLSYTVLRRQQLMTS
jgi:hypothetical protein